MRSWTDFAIGAAAVLALVTGCGRNAAVTALVEAYNEGTTVLETMHDGPSVEAARPELLAVADKLHAAYAGVAQELGDKKRLTWTDEEKAAIATARTNYTNALQRALPLPGGLNLAIDVQGRSAPVAEMMRVLKANPALFGQGSFSMSANLGGARVEVHGAVPPNLVPGGAPNLPAPVFPAPSPSVELDPISSALAKLKQDNVFAQKDGAVWLAKAEVVEARRGEVLKALKALVDNHRTFVPRRESVQAIATWGSRDETRLFVDLLDDNDGGVREEALYALAKLKDPAAAEAIATVLPRQRDQASDALKAIGAPAESAVLPLLDNPDEGVRIKACEILKKIGTAASYPALIKLATEDGRLGEAAREALPAAKRPTIYGKQATIRVCVVDGALVGARWPEFEAKFRALADGPDARIKVNTSGACKWVELCPVTSDAETFSRKIDFGRVTATHNNQRLVYVQLR